MSGLRIRTNVSALFAQRQLGYSTAALQKSSERLSSGFRINSSADDAAGFGISERMRAQISGLTQAQRNAQDGASMVQVAEGGLNQITLMLQRLRTLAVQSANGSNTTADRRLIQTEVNQLLAEISRQASATSFNGLKLLTGRANGTNSSLSFQVGADKGQTLEFNIASVSLRSLGISRLSAPTTSSTGGILTQAAAESAISTIDSAINTIVKQRADLGALQNRMENAIAFISISVENQTAAESRIRDTDFTTEVTNYTRQQILQQTGVSMLAQANIQPQAVLELLQ